MKKIKILYCLILLLGTYSCYNEITEDVPKELIYWNTEEFYSSFIDEYESIRDAEYSSPYHETRYRRESGLMGDYNETYFTFEREKAEEDAAEGSALAQYCLLKEGGGFGSNFDKYKDLLEKNANSGNIKAQYYCFGLYSSNNFFVENLKKAFYWLEKGAENGNKEAQYLLALMYKDGYKQFSILKNPLKFIYWLKKSGEQGYYYAQHNLAIMYFWGIGIDKDKTQAFYWFKKLAEAGDDLGQNELIYMYEKGIGTERDKELALYWLKRSAQEGNKVAQCKLGLKYYRGNGIPKDKKQAVFWIKKSYEKGYEEAKKVWNELELWQYE